MSFPGFEYMQDGNKQKQKTKLTYRAEEMAQRWLRTQATLLEDPELIANTYVGAHNHL